MLRPLLTFISLAVCVATLTLVWIQQRQLAVWHSDELQARTESSPGISASVSNDASAVVVEQHSPSPELLRLRGQVGQLERHRRELAGVRAENESLRVQLANRGTNTAGGLAFPAGYLRMVDAKFVGYDTPEATLQTMMWAVQKQSVEDLLQVLSPKYAREVVAEIQKAGSSDEFFKGANGVPGLQVLGQPEATAAADEVVLHVEVVPDGHAPGEKPQELRFKLIGGQWKLNSGF